MRIAVAGGSGVAGRYVVEAARAAGHDPVVLSRSAGVDLRRDEGVVAALGSVEVIVDTTNPRTTSGPKATEFFTDVTRRLQAAGAAAGVARLVSLSIVGLERVPGFGYYEAKLAQERAAADGPLPVTVVRATQFHEFPAELLTRSMRGPVALMPVMRIQPVAARSVGEILVEVASGPPPDAIVEVAGPEREDLVDLARRLLRRHGRRALVLPLPVPGAAGRAMRSGAQRPTNGARIVGPTFEAWLGSPDAAPADPRER